MIVRKEMIDRKKVIDQIEMIDRKKLIGQREMIDLTSTNEPIIDETVTLIVLGRENIIEAVEAAVAVTIAAVTGIVVAVIVTTQEIIATKPEIFAMKPEITVTKPETIAMKPEAIAMIPETAVTNPEIIEIEIGRRQHSNTNHNRMIAINERVPIPQKDLVIRIDPGQYRVSAQICRPC